MATTDRQRVTAPADALAERLREASFAHFLVRSDGESLAGAGLLVAACVAMETPYLVSLVRTRADVAARIEASDDGTTVIAIGVPDAAGAEAGDVDVDADADVDVDGPWEHPSVTAFEVADEVGAAPDPALALAGLVAGGASPAEVAPAIVDRSGFERRPGLAVPTTDPVDGLTHSTLIHAPYSGDRDAVEALVRRVRGDTDDGGRDTDQNVTAAADSDADADGDADATNRRLASVVAIDAVMADGASDRAASAIVPAIHPLVGGPLVTVGGLADVLLALASLSPGRGVALALGGDPTPALDEWRDHARAAHSGVHSAEMTRHDGLLVARTDGPVETVARLLRDFRSPEPAVVAVGREEAALATVDAPADPIESAAAAVAGSGLARRTSGYARFEAGREAAFVDAVREAI